MGASLDAALEARVRELVADELRRRGLDAVALRYSTSNLPPGTSVRTFHGVCRSGVVCGAEKLGREWSCPTESWRAARRRPARAAAPKLALVKTEPDDDALAEAAVQSLGRRTR